MKKGLFALFALLLLFISEICIAQIVINSQENWDHDVNPNNDIEIRSGGVLTISPGATEATHLNMDGYTLTINSGGTFILNPNASATINSIVNNGTLILESKQGEQGVASLIHNGYSGSPIEVKLYLTGGTTEGDEGVPIWHYISIPLSGVSADFFGTLNLARFVESLTAVNNNDPGWVAYDGYQYLSGNTLPSYGFSELTLGVGYNYYSADSKTFTFSGTPVIDEVSPDISYTLNGGSTDYIGYNLVGNPFLSCVNWNLIHPSYTTNLANAIYFTNKGQMAAYVAGLAVNGGTDFIQPMQGFFVKATGSNPSITFDPDARAHKADQMRYKKKGNEEYNPGKDTVSFLRLSMYKSTDSTELVVRFNNKATPAFDSEFDAYLFGRTMGNINIWTTSGKSDYCINALPFPENPLEIPVGINLKTAGTFRFSSREINRLDDYSVILKDLSTNQSADLKKGESIEFSSPAGMITGRFVLTVTKSTSGIPETSIPAKLFNIYTGEGKTINIRSLHDASPAVSGSVNIFDINGRLIMQNTKTEWSGTGDLKQFVLNTSRPGLYFVVVETGTDRQSEKVVLK